MIYFYSAKNNAFYPQELKEAYQRASTWPDDLVEITEEEYQPIILAQSFGKVIAADNNGFPVLKEPIINWQGKAKSDLKNRLLDVNNIVSDWKAELQLGTLSEENKAKLISWLEYANKLKALDVGDVTTEDDYKNIDWPAKPA